MSYAGYILGRAASTLLWLLGMAAFALAHQANLAVYHRIAPHRKPANCWEWNSLDWDRLQREWRENGSIPGTEPYLLARSSRQRPNWVGHVFTSAHRDHDTGEMPLRSYSPVDPKDVPLWRCWERLNFEGYTKHGDQP